MTLDGRTQRRGARARTYDRGHGDQDPGDRCVVRYRGQLQPHGHHLRGQPRHRTGELEAAAGRELVAVGRLDLAPPAPGPAPAPPVAGAPARFSADGALNKAGLLGLVALVVGTLAYVADAPVGLAWAGMLVGLGVGLWCSFSPRRAPVLAPVFAVVEGGVLGVISRFYAGQGSHVVPLAVVGTVAIVAAVWAVYRTGLVRVGTRFVRTALVAGIGMLAVMVTSLLTGWGTTGLGGLLIFGVLYLVLAVMYLFVDFSFVDRAEAAGLDADAEWFSAFMLLQSSMMVYLALLRIFGGRN